MLLRSPCTVLKSVSIAAFAFGAMACEPMEPSGKPFSAVSVQAVGSEVEEVSATADNRFEKLESLGSEDLRLEVMEPTSGSDESVRVGAAVSPHTASAVPSASPAVGGVAASPAPADVVAAVAAAAATPSGMGGWPVRLVRTHLDEQPPSAILALPDGRRVVVSPGDMVPERGLVVMAIGKDRVHLAEVSGEGDHATVTPLELAAQY